MKRMITKEEIYEKAGKFLIGHIGNLVAPGEPVYDNKVKVWIVPIIHMSDVAVFPIGEIVFDGNGKILYAPHEKELDEMCEKS